MAAEPAGAKEPNEKGKGVAGMAIAALVATVMAGATGAGMAMMARKPATASPAASEQAAASAGEGGAKSGGHEEKNELARVRGFARLSPIVTNLRDPPEAWVRLETAVIVDEIPKADFEKTKVAIERDILAYLRSVSLPSLQGARGLLHLQDDLDERASIRTDGKITHVYINGLVLE